MLAESYAYYFSKNTPMKIKYFKAQIVFLLWAVASAANAEYTVDDGTIRYVPVVTVSYSLENGQEVLETLPEGQTLDFSMQQSAMFRGDNCQEGCGNITIGKGQGEARFSVDVKVFDRFRYTYKVEKTIDFWDGIQRGTCQ